MNYHDDYELQMEKEILDMMAKVSDDILNKAANMMMDGCTDGEIQNTLGISKSSIYRYRRDGVLPYNGHHVTGKTFIPKDVKLPELQPGQRMDGTPECKFANLPYKECPDTEIPFTELPDDKAMEAEECHNIPERPYKPEIGVSDSCKGKSKGKAKLTRETHLKGVYVKCEILDELVSVDVENLVSTIPQEMVDGIDNLIAELEEVKLALTAGVY